MAKKKIEEEASEVVTDVQTEMPHAAQEEAWRPQEGDTVYHPSTHKPLIVEGVTHDGFVHASFSLSHDPDGDRLSKKYPLGELKKHR